MDCQDIPIGVEILTLDSNQTRWFTTHPRVITCSLFRPTRFEVARCPRRQPKQALVSYSAPSNTITDIRRY